MGARACVKIDLFLHGISSLELPGNVSIGICCKQRIRQWSARFEEAYASERNGRPAATPVGADRKTIAKILDIAPRGVAPKIFHMRSKAALRVAEVLASVDAPPPAAQ
jgi:hypothetical protein